MPLDAVSFHGFHHAETSRFTVLSIPFFYRSYHTVTVSILFLSYFNGLCRFLAQGVYAVQGIPSTRLTHRARERAKMKVKICVAGEINSGKR